MFRPNPYPPNVAMRWFIQFSLFGLLACLLIAAPGCNGSDSETTAETETSQDNDHDHDHDGHDHDGHDHDGHDHEGHDHDGHDHEGGEHADGSEHAHPETYDDAVAELVAVNNSITENFAADKTDDAHGPLHDVFHLLEDTKALVQKSDMDADTKTKLDEAIEELFTCYGEVDGKLHNEDEGKEFSEVADQIAAAIKTLQAQVTESKE